MAHSPRDIDPADDGRTIADMSDVRRPSLFALGGQHDARRANERGEQQPSRDFADELQSPEERLMVILGALRGALSIWLVYVVVFGIIILLMVLLWG